jgi:hypothetical protein
LYRKYARMIYTGTQVVATKVIADAICAQAGFGGVGTAGCAW